MANYLTSALKQFEYYKGLGQKTIESLTFEELSKEVVEGSNSINIIVKHLAGNMLSRWTNFLTEDGEKGWRKRDEEFIDTLNSKDDVLKNWTKGWQCLFNGLKNLNEEDLNRIIYIRNEGHTVTEALNRQMMHYAYHIGQIVLIGKQLKGDSWKSLSIPKGESEAYNKNKFRQNRQNKHFTDDI